MEESGETEAGLSLQLTGDGLLYGDFSWMANLPSSPGAINASQSISTSAPSDTLPPVFTYGYPRAVNITEDRFDILLNFSEACTVYYMARISGSESPDNLEIQSEIIAHQDGYQFVFRMTGANNFSDIIRNGYLLLTDDIVFLFKNNTIYQIKNYIFHLTYFEV